jgi:hypothetical protein
MVDWYASALSTACCVYKMLPTSRFDSARFSRTDAIAASLAVSSVSAAAFFWRENASRRSSMIFFMAIENTLLSCD